MWNPSACLSVAFLKDIPGEACYFYMVFVILLFKQPHVLFLLLF